MTRVLELEPVKSYEKESEEGAFLWIFRGFPKVIIYIDDEDNNLF